MKQTSSLSATRICKNKLRQHVNRSRQKKRTNEQLKMVTRMPPRLKKLGYANAVVGPLVALVNIVIIGKSLSRLAGLGASKGIIVPLVFIVLVFCVLGAILFIGGIGLIKGRRWGRIWSLGFAFGS